MNPLPQHTMVLIGLTGLCFALLVGEYLLLAWHPEWLRAYDISIAHLQKLNAIMPFLRLGTSLLYSLTLIAIQTTPVSQKRRALKKMSPLVLAVLISLCLGSFWFIWELPNMSLFWWRYAYPLAILVLGVATPLIITTLLPAKAWGIQASKRKLKSAFGLGTFEYLFEIHDRLNFGKHNF